MSDVAILEALETGPLFGFGAVPPPSVPNVAAGMYAIWRGNDFIYVGMAGRALTQANVVALRKDPRCVKGLRDRLNSHASGRRSGDQFCIYVCDRLIIPQLTAEQLQALKEGTLSLDECTRRFIHKELRYRVAVTPDGRTAQDLERRIQKRGLPKAGRPLLLPLSHRSAAPDGDT